MVQVTVSPRITYHTIFRFGLFLFLLSVVIPAPRSFLHTYIYTGRLVYGFLSAVLPFSSHLSTSFRSKFYS